MHHTIHLFTVSATLVMLGAPAAGVADQLEITVTNRAAQNGLFLTPIWVGFHDGTFDLFDPGTPLTPGGGMENLAEDGVVGVLSDEFAASASGLNGGVDGVVFGPDGFPGAPVLDPRERSTIVVDVDAAANRYFSFASMVIPSNDAFIGNGNPTMFELFDEDGVFTGPLDIRVAGDMVWDAGTEANTEMDAAFFNQAAPDTGVTTADPVMLHEGFKGSFGNPDADPIILGGVSGPGIFFHPIIADFTKPGAQLVRIRIRLLD